MKKKNPSVEFYGFFEAYQKGNTMLDKEQIRALLEKLLPKITLEELVIMFINRFDAYLQYIRLGNGEHTGTDISLLFNPHRLLTHVKEARKETLFEALSQPYMAQALARTIPLQGIANRRGFKSFIEMNVNGVVLPQEFPPYAMRKLLLEYKMNRDCAILDPCAGWGGRMLGASVVCDSYTAYEPSTKTYKGLKKLGVFIQEATPTFKFKVHNIPFEEAVLPKGFYDIAITSPPYYDTEEYSEESTNSFNKFETFEEWCEGFYLPLIKKTMRALKPTGVFILNIGNRKYPLTDTMMNAFEKVYHIRAIGNRVGGSDGLSKKAGKGEMFFEIKHRLK